MPRGTAQYFPHRVARRCLPRFSPQQRRHGLAIGVGHCVARFQVVGRVLLQHALIVQGADRPAEATGDDRDQDADDRGAAGALRLGDVERHQLITETHRTACDRWMSTAIS